MNKWIKKLTAALCAAVLMCGMAVTAYAGGGDMGYPAKSEDFVGRGGATEQSGCSPQGGRSGAEFVTTRDGLDPVEPLPTETVDPGEGFTEDGNLVTRDLLYDKATNKQFITVQTSGGNTIFCTQTVPRGDRKGGTFHAGEKPGEQPEKRSEGAQRAEEPEKRPQVSRRPSHTQAARKTPGRFSFDFLCVH